jgi:ribonuclease HI
MSNWDRNGWHNVANKDLFVQLRDIISKIETTFEYVPSRDNRADPLARQGAAKSF